MAIPENTDLVRDAAQGNHEAFETLVNRHAGMVTGVAYSVCGDFSLSEDIGQEVFVEAWKKLSTIRDPENFAGWICTIARRRAIDAVRAKNSTHANCSIDNMPFEIPDRNQVTPEANMSMNQEREWIWSMLSELPEMYREPMVLFYRCEESTRDVAIALGEKESTIRQRLKRGREMLRTEMTQSIRKTLGETAPKAAFAALVMASLPSTTYAAGASATTAVAGKASGVGSTVVKSAAATAFGGAAIGSLIGVAGGALGTWMSWKNCEYESQQRLIVRRTMHLLFGMLVFGILVGVLITAKVQGLLASNSLFVGLLAGLHLLAVGCTCLWVWRFNLGYKRLADEARAAGEPVREFVQRQRDDVRKQTQVVRADGSIGYEAFQWRAAPWFGSCIGSTAWMVPLAVASIWFGSTGLGMFAIGCFLVALLLASVAWVRRDHLFAYWSFQFAIAAAMVLTAVVLVAISTLANAETLQYLQWTPWGWLVLLMYPAISLYFWWIRRSFERRMLQSPD
ncbi:RNA polymerase sigma factor [Stieleria varia]|uniref:ECF RNA polymerase sigma factor SigW n=1 Tax=Stieleria varia TaxID=2528005 RepID=A0A5C6B2E5_9BACT|nr:sigma-70 family RNA polymerase sigma factor [Stieleria varia]TWU06313.1 ECF RNA polymerase sigma factor SigW [Stieleria varia]